MNILLFTAEEMQNGLPKSDFRSRHLLQILKTAIGDSFSAGIIGKSVGKATLTGISDTLSFSFTESETPPCPTAPITLICGLTRPPVARRILKDAATAGIQTLHFVSVENSERSYLQSKLWTTDDRQTALLEGAMQGGSVFFPKVELWKSVSHLFRHNEFSGDCILLDNAGQAPPLSLHLQQNRETAETVLAIGGERGWTDSERSLFANRHFVPASLGPRILRTETAASASILMAENIKYL